LVSVVGILGGGVAGEKLSASMATTASHSWGTTFTLE
jgi:hypothetical protein